MCIRDRNMTVQNTRVGQVTDYDKLTLDVYTNGTLAPDEAVSLAAKVLISRTFSFSSFSFSTITSAVLAFSERSMNRLKCSLSTFAARLTASSGASVPLVLSLIHIWLSG